MLFQSSVPFVNSKLRPWMEHKTNQLQQRKGVGNHMRKVISERKEKAEAGEDRTRGKNTTRKNTT